MRHEGYDRLRRMVELAAPADQVWAAIGGFGSLADWHPLIDSVELVEIDGEPHRHLTTVNGELLLERLVEEGPRHLVYEILDSPFPFTDYRSVLSCVPEAQGCHVFWSAHFEALDPKADEIVGAVYEAGLRALRDRFGAPD